MIGGDEDVMALVLAKLDTEPVEDLRIDFEDGYGDHGDDEEDRAAAAAARPSVPPSTPAAPRPSPASGSAARARHPAAGRPDPGAVPGGAGPDPPTASSSPSRRSPRPTRSRRWRWLCDHVEKDLAGRLLLRGPGRDAAVRARRRRPGDAVAHGGRRGGPAHRLPLRHLRLQRRLGIAAGQQAPDHPAADHAKPVMQVAVAGTGARLSTGPPTAAGRRPAGPRVARARTAGPALARARLLPGLGPPPGAAADPVRRDVRLLPGRLRRGRRPAAHLRRARTPRSWTSRRPRAPSPTTSCGAWTAGRWGRPRSSPRPGWSRGR